MMKKIHKSKNITQKELKETLIYFPKTGIFKWKINVGCKIKKGTLAGGLHPNGYNIIRIYNKGYKASRLAFLYMEGYFPENQVDHINRIRNDDKWKNLREVSHQCNQRNKNIYKNNKSKVCGVVWHKRDKRWMVNIRINNKRIYLGYFKKKKEAIIVRWKAEVRYNWPNCNSSSSAYLWLKKRKFL